MADPHTTPAPTTAAATAPPTAPIASRFHTPPAQPAKTFTTTKDGTLARVHLDHSPGASGDVALFLPNGFDPGKPAIIMPYLHGHGGSIADTLDRQRMTELAAKSGKNIAFVIPQLGAHSDIKPAYRDPAYAQKFLDESATALAKTYTQAHPGADPAQTSAAFHAMPVVPLSYSGGYQATIPLLKQPQTKGVVLLDSMYSSSAPFVDFSKRPGAFVSVVYGPTTKDHTGEFAQGAAKGTAHTVPNPSSHTDLVQTALGPVLQSLSINPDNSVTAVTPAFKTQTASAAPRTSTAHG